MFLSTSRPARAALAKQNLAAASTAVSARSVRARAARIIGQAPPISASAMSSAASLFMRRSNRIASTSSLHVATARAFWLRRA